MSAGGGGVDSDFKFAEQAVHRLARVTITSPWHGPVTSPGEPYAGRLGQGSWLH